MLLPLVQDKDRTGHAIQRSDWPSELPVLPLRNVVAFPDGLLPLAVGLERSIRLLEDVLEGDRLVVLAAMTDPAVEEPGPDGVYQIGTLATVERALRINDDYQIMVRGLARVRIVDWLAEKPYLKVRVESFPETFIDEAEIEALRRELLDAARRMVVFFPQVPEGIVDILDQIDEPSTLLYMIASNVRLEAAQAQQVLAGQDLTEQMRILLTTMQHELEVLELGQKIREEAQGEMEQAQREYYLRQQMKAIQKELGEDSNDENGDYRRKIEEAGLPE